MERSTTTTTGQATAKKATWWLVLALMSATLPAAASAVARLSRGIGQESESGGVEIEAEIADEGDFAFQCAPV